MRKHNSTSAYLRLPSDNLHPNQKNFHHLCLFLYCRYLYHLSIVFRRNIIVCCSFSNLTIVEQPFFWKEFCGNKMENNDGKAKEEANVGKEGENKFPVSIRVYVGNLPYNVSWQRLKDHFKPCGNVVYADVLRDTDGRSKVSSRCWL